MVRPFLRTNPRFGSIVLEVQVQGLQVGQLAHLRGQGGQLIAPQVRGTLQFGVAGVLNKSSNYV